MINLAVIELPFGGLMADFKPSHRDGWTQAGRKMPRTLSRAVGSFSCPFCGARAGPVANGFDKIRSARITKQELKVQLSLGGN